MKLKKIIFALLAGFTLTACAAQNVSDLPQSFQTYSPGQQWQTYDPQTVSDQAVATFNSNLHRSLDMTFTSYGKISKLTNSICVSVDQTKPESIEVFLANYGEIIPDQDAVVDQLFVGAVVNSICPQYDYLWKQWDNAHLDQT